jgi:hypothetical protein
MQLGGGTLKQSSSAVSQGEGGEGDGIEWAWVARLKTMWSMSGGRWRPDDARLNIVRALGQPRLGSQDRIFLGWLSTRCFAKRSRTSSSCSFRAKKKVFLVQ